MPMTYDIMSPIKGLMTSTPTGESLIVCSNHQKKSMDNGERHG